ncbi:MAG: restriction endonuclease subunit S, partial [Gammaproteobacteria bacterium]|nr:restriction endonuclease subunit S [Gammaproteobacteria bacterium]
MNWPISTIGEVCAVVSGATPRTGNPEYWDGDIPWVTPKDLSELSQKYLSDTSRKITEAGLRSCSARILPARSVLLSSRAPIGLVAMNTLPVCTNQGFKSMVPRDGCIAPDYLYWWLKTHREALEHRGRGATFKEVSKKIVEEIAIPVPPLAEQKRIAGILDAADTLRVKRREVLVQLDTLLQSTFLDMFGDPVTNPMGWHERTLGELAQNRLRNGLSPSSQGTIDGEVLTLSAITSGRFDFTARKKTRFDRQPSPSQKLSSDTFLICRGNGNRNLVGIGTYPDRSSSRICFPDTMIGVTMGSNIIKYPSHKRTPVFRGATCLA